MPQKPAGRAAMLILLIGANLHGKAFIDYLDFQKYYKMKRKIMYKKIDTLSELSKFER